MKSKALLIAMVLSTLSLASSGGDGEGPQFKGIKSKTQQQRILAAGGDGVGPRGPKGGQPGGGKPEGGDGVGPRKNS
jgi:hypothetical protein